MPRRQPTKAELLDADEDQFDPEGLVFDGLRGDRARHWRNAELVDALAALPPRPRDEGELRLLVARGATGERQELGSAMLSVEDGLSEDRWRHDPRYGPDYQLATICEPVARLIARGQPLSLHGDNLHVDLDLSSSNLPTGSQLRIGQARLEVTPVAHNGCKKWVQRFGLAPMQLHLAPSHRHLRLRGLYLRVVEPGRVTVGDPVRVLERGPIT